MIPPGPTALRSANTFSTPKDARSTRPQTHAMGSSSPARAIRRRPPGQGTAVPASSSCSTFASTDIYGGGTTVRLPGATFVPSTTVTPTTSTTSRATSTPTTAGTKNDLERIHPVAGPNRLGGSWTTTHTRAVICAFSATVLIVTFFL